MWMGDRARSQAFWLGTVVVFLIALLMRLSRPASRYLIWYGRSVHFWDALLTGNLSNTYQQYHPGVTTMWIAGFGLRMYAAAHGWSSSEILDPPGDLSGPQGQPAQMGVAALSLVIAVCVALAYVLLSRVVNWPTAFSAGFLLALDPFYITHSKMIHVDALLASFMLVSALSLIGYLEENNRAYLIVSGIFAGLALLTKSPAAFLIPYAALVLALHHVIIKDGSSGHFSNMCISGHQLQDAFRSLGLWILVAVCVFLLLWPAMWVQPGRTLSKMKQSILRHAEASHPNPNFFAGRIVKDPGPLYYPASLAWKTTSVTLPAVGAAVLLLIRRKCEEDRGFVWYMWMYAGGFLLMMTLAAKKWSRYVLPTFVALDVLAGWGLAQGARMVEAQVRRRGRAWISLIIITAALILQAFSVLRHHPYYGTHHNRLLGGSQTAKHILHLGDQGEGLDRAARFLNSRPGAERLTVGVQDTQNLMFRSIFAGHIEPIDHPDVDYRVFFIHYNQRDIGFRRHGTVASSSREETLWNACRRAGPIWSTSFDGVPYVWICRAYPHDPRAFAMDRRLDVQVGDKVRLLGYRLSSSEIAAGDTLTVTLFWRSEGRLVGDYHVFTHLLSGDRELGAQHDSVPVHGERPTWSWQDEEVIQDEHGLVLDQDVPTGTYTLSTGMYDFLTKCRLPAFGPAGERLPEDRVVLQDIRVTPAR